ncbi:MAG: hypothetical protein ACTSPB_00415 [Candidatus Thorarchaeota archaeon]
METPERCKKDCNGCENLFNATDGVSDDYRCLIGLDNHISVRHY